MQSAHTFPFAADQLADCFRTYMLEAQTSTNVAINASAVEATGKPAMRAGLDLELQVSKSKEAFSALFVASIERFWAAMVANPTAFLVGSLAITPPLYADLPVTLKLIMDQNHANGSTRAEATDAFAAAIHAATAGLGTATFPGPVVVPII